LAPAICRRVSIGVLAVWQLVLGAIAISFSAVVVKLVHVPPTESGFYRVFFGGVILLGVVLWRREHPRLDSSSWGKLLLAGLFFALDLFLWHRSILYIGPGIATLLANFQVFVMAAVGVLFLKERLSLFQWLGIIMAIISAVAYAGYLLALRSTRGATGGSSYSAIAITSLASAAILAVSLTVEGQSFAIPTWADGGWLLLYGLVPQVLGWVLISHSMHKVGASQVGLVLLLQPACAFIWDSLFFGRHFTALELAGAGITLAAIYLGSLKSKGLAKTA